MIVTRTMPLGNGGRFTKECREVYVVVLEMQEVSARSLLPLSLFSPRRVLSIHYSMVCRRLTTFVGIDQSDTSGCTLGFYPITLSSDSYSLVSSSWDF